jgi:hypothetical protein
MTLAEWDRAIDKSRTRTPYTPVDVMLAIPRSRLLIALRFSDAVTFEELCIRVGAEDGNMADVPERAALCTALCRLGKDGLVTKLWGSGRDSMYLLTKAGRVEADAVRRCQFKPRNGNRKRRVE